MADQPISLTGEQRRRVLLEQKGRHRNMGGSDKGEKPNDWVKDLGGVLKSAGKNTAKAADAVSDVLVDKDAWKAIAPGGKKATVSDYANVALDASMLIPGVGLAGGAARVAARQGAKALAKEGARVAERKLSPMAERVIAREGANAGAHRAGAAGGRRIAEGVKPKTGPAFLDAPKTSVNNLLEKTAVKQERGIGTKIGLGQTKKRVAANALITGGANLVTRAYDESGKSKANPKKGAGGVAPSTAAEGGQPAYLIGDLAYPLPVDSGGGIQIPSSVQRALADYLNKGGSPDGAQVVYLGH